MNSNILIKDIASIILKNNIDSDIDDCYEKFSILSDEEKNRFKSLYGLLNNKDVNDIERIIKSRNLSDEMLMKFKDFILYKKLADFENEILIDEFDLENQSNSSSNASIYFSDLSNSILLTPEEEYDLAVKVKNGDKSAKDKLIESNLRLVVSIAKRYATPTIQLLDLIQEGNKGLITAAGKFDPYKGYKFSTYAIWWIRQAVTRYIAISSRTIRVSAYAHDLLVKIRKYREAYSKKYGDDPSMFDIASEFGLTVDYVSDLLFADEVPISLNSPVNPTTESDPLEDFIKDDTNESVEDTVMKKSLTEEITKVLDNLSEREREIIIKRFGLYNNEEQTLNQVGEELGISRERVRQIQERAFEILRRPQNAKYLLDFIEKKESIMNNLNYSTRKIHKNKK